MASYEELIQNGFSRTQALYLINNRILDARRLNLKNGPIIAYGNSYVDMGPKSYYTPGKHWLTRAAESVGAGGITSYAISGTQIIDVCGGLVNGSAIGGTSGQTAGALWPGTSARQGLTILETVVNDIVHSLTATGYTPAAITNANTQYLDGIRNMYRHALALMSSESRVEAEAAVLTGTWPAAINSAAYSGGVIRRTSTIAAKAAFTVTPPQYGPLAGKVFLIGAKVNVATAALTQMTIDVDGANPFNYTPTPWETGQGSASAYDCVAITVPVDGLSHTVNVTHSGTAAQFIYADALIVPSVNPNPIAVMGAERPIRVGFWNAQQVIDYKANMQKVLPVLKSVVAEFPNAFYVPSTMTDEGLYSLDGIHPNDLGQSQRASDLVAAAQSVAPRYRAQELITAESYGIL